MRDSCRSSGTGETPQVLAPRRLIVHPAESEHPEAEINQCILLYSKQQSLRKQPFIITKILAAHVHILQLVVTVLVHGVMFEKDLVRKFENRRQSLL